MSLELSATAVREAHQDLISWEAEHLWFTDASSAEIDILRKVRPFTLTLPARLLTLLYAVKHVVSNAIPGDFVECGVWRGGSAMAMALMLKELNDSDRRIWMYDTFAGMPAPSDLDSNLWGEAAIEKHRQANGEAAGSNWVHASLDEVAANLASTGFAANRYFMIKGLVEQTIPEQAPERISLLRLDTDFYESTQHQLEHLVCRVPKGGIVIIDDYGHWKGAARAVDEYIGKLSNKPFLHRIDYASRLWVVC